MNSIATEPIFISLAVFASLYIFIFYGLRFWFRRASMDIGSVALSVSQIPILIIAILSFFKIALAQLKSTSIITWVERGLTAVIVITVTYWVAQLLNEVVVYALKQFAQTSEAQWDDVIIPIMESSLPIVIYVIGGVLSLQAIKIDLTGLWVAVGGAAFILGFALQNILADFFSGLVLLIDTPFRFGDVITLADGTKSVIKKVGLRVTNLYVFNQHCELYVPNSALHRQQILNLSRPTSHYYYTLNVPVTSDADPARVIQLMQAVVLAHPDTLGLIDQKLEFLDQLYGMSGDPVRVEHKRQAGHQRLSAEKKLNTQLMKIEQAFDSLSNKISYLEKGGLDANEIRRMQGDFLEICQMIGMDTMSNLMTKRRRALLEEAQDKVGEEKLIGLIRQWYSFWLKDPDLLPEDYEILPKQWEQKIEFLKRKVNKLFRKFSNPSGDETRLDDAVMQISSWMRENFKTTRNQWQEPKIWLSEVREGMSKNFSVKFYVDDITLEHFERGNRVESEVNRELAWQLRRAYLSL
ncbi:mechanosensitive ion channel family protein [Brasilonema sp. UFV-L1]|uniref:mechanosensitive ion channel family protein n=1 Tax=Brasilonema sp. UFV-L1 TaxID=2234130 RepID=UPI00145DA8E2|nr:mechanosensitive ion channel family protein [Brasilonema sp. UFV-L1]NMG05517.1 mechanosensitive ion channel family protein [Brasilonema sp. UFV-L1]